MKKLDLNLSVEFSNDIKDSQIKGVMKRVLGALINEVVSGNGIAPDDDESLTNRLKISFNPEISVQHVFTTIPQYEIDMFLHDWCTPIRNDETLGEIELMVDNHYSIKYPIGTKGYYIPKSSSFYTTRDEKIIDYLISNYSY